jgi:hypothetical protein
LRGLAKLIGREAEYILLYKMVSEVAHAGDVMTEIIQGSTKGIEVHHLRGPVGKMKEVTSLSANLLVWCHEHMLASYFLSGPSELFISAA